MADVRVKTIRDPKQSAVITRDRLKKQRGAIERFTAWVVLLVSFLGSIAALHGGWPPLIDSLTSLQPRWAPLLGGLAIQAGLTFLEWWYYDQRVVSWPARLIDTATTALGYGPLVVVGIARAIGPELAPGADPDVAYITVAWVIVGLVSLLVAWYPESRLVE